MEELYSHSIFIPPVYIIWRAIINIQESYIRGMYICQLHIFQKDFIFQRDGAPSPRLLHIIIVIIIL
jgi:hypothetical protein